MSNATPDTRGAGGERRRRRSRGGKGRNRNRQNGSQGENQNRQQQGQRNPQRQDRGPRPPRREHKPAPLTWWQKLLKLIGLYKEPVRPPRKQREEPKPRLNIEETPVKSNTRIAKSAEGGQRRNQDRPARSDRPERTEVGSSRIYLGNLSYDSTEEDLKDLFKGVGTVRRVEIVYNRRTHKSKGYGFVDMLNVEEAKRSVEVLHDQFFMGRKLVVSGAKSKEYDDAQREEEEERKAPAASAAAPVAAAAIPVVAAEVTAPAPVEDAPQAEAPAATPVEEAPQPEAPAEEEPKA